MKIMRVTPEHIGVRAKPGVGAANRISISVFHI